MDNHPAIAALKATAPHRFSPMPWKPDTAPGDDEPMIRDANGDDVGRFAVAEDRDHALSATLAAPHLLARVAELEAALDAALGEPQHLGTSARDWCGMWDIARARADVAEAKLKALVASWPAHYHRQGCPWGACNCGADAANAARAEARRLCGVDNA